MKKILVIQQKMIGDVLLSSLICENIKIFNPNYEVHYLVNSNTIPVLENNPYIDKLIIFDEKKDASFFNLIKFSKTLNQNTYDVVIDAYTKLQSYTMVGFNKAKTKIAIGKYGRKFLFTYNLKKHHTPKSFLGLAIEHRLMLLEPLNVPVNKNFPTLYVTEDEKRNAKDLFKKHKVNSGLKTVMISVLGSEQSKTYPLEYMAKIIDYIGLHFNLNILFNYIPNQLEDAQKIYNLCSKTTQNKIFFELYGTSLRDFITIMDKCDFIIGNDGGAINMAKALNKNSFIIFSPWINKQAWASFEDGINHVSVHLKDFKPELFIGKKTKELKINYKSLYIHFTEELILKKLHNFIDLSLNN